MRFAFHIVAFAPHVADQTSFESFNSHARHYIISSPEMQADLSQAFHCPKAHRWINQSPVA